jgi:pyruvate dehydrogenase E1 component alpha subunit
MNWETLCESYRLMLLIRAAEERIGEWVERGDARCPCHLYIGQEAVAVGVCTAMGDGDTVWGNHRSHGHYLARGASLTGLFAEILGKSTGCARGRGGSMHLIAKEQGILGTVPIVAATIPLAVGAGLAAKLRGNRCVSVAFFGDGATEEGHFHESLNLAALYKLPVIFVCENNLYASHLHWSERRPAANLHQVGALYDVPGLCLDGNDVEAVHAASVEAMDRARAGAGPSFLECRTYRWRGHVGHRWDMDVGVMRRGELQEWVAKCPIKQLRERLLQRGVTEEHLSAIAESVRQAVAEAEAEARLAPWPEESELLDHVYCPESVLDAQPALPDAAPVRKAA